MRLQFHVPAEAIGLNDPMSAEQTTQLVDQLRGALTTAGFQVEDGSDFADVDEDYDDYAILTPAEREDGGYTFPDLSVVGSTGVVVSIFKREVFFCSDGGFGDEQAGAVEIVKVVLALTSVIPVPETVLDDVRTYADQLAVDPDGTIRRPVISGSEESKRAIELFDRVVSPELLRPTAEKFEREHCARLKEMTFDTGPFRIAMAIDPYGRVTKTSVPRELAKKGSARDSYEEVSDEMDEVLTEALRQPWQATGLPTGLEVRFDGTRLRPRLMFDTPVDAGSIDEGERADRVRLAPHAWKGIAIAAAARDPRFQPSWLQEALEIIAAGGRDDLIVNQERTADPSELPPRSLGDRLRSRMPRRRD